MGIVYVTRPPKPVSQMSDEELDAWATGVVEAFREAIGWSGGHEVVTETSGRGRIRHHNQGGETPPHRT
jgi:hypothetical protein